MTNVIRIILADGQSTPVNHNFDLVKVDQKGIAKFTDRSSGIAIGFPVLTHLLEEPSKTAKSYKVSGRVALPILETISNGSASGYAPAPQLAYTLFSEVRCTLPERSSMADRKNLIAYTRSYVNSSEFASAVLNYDTVYTAFSGA